MSGMSSAEIGSLGLAFGEGASVTKSDLSACGDEVRRVQKKKKKKKQLIIGVVMKQQKGRKKNGGRGAPAQPALLQVD